MSLDSRNKCFDCHEPIEGYVDGNICKACSQKPQKANSENAEHKKDE